MTMTFPCATALFCDILFVEPLPTMHVVMVRCGVYCLRHVVRVRRIAKQKSTLGGEITMSRATAHVGTSTFQCQWIQWAYDHEVSDCRIMNGCIMH